MFLIGDFLGMVILTRSFYGWIALIKFLKLNVAENLHSI